MMLIRLNKLIIEGSEYKRTLKFLSGLNLIQGDKYSGKSLILNLIDYLFGEKDGINQKAQKELFKHCEFVMLDLKIGELFLTLKRNLWKDKSYIEVYFCEVDKMRNYAPRIIPVSEFSRFLFDLLDIPEFKLLKHLRHSKEYTLDTLSFRDLFRYVYVDQHELGTPAFMGLNDHAKKTKNKTMFEVLFGYLEYDTENLVNKIKELENERVNIEMQIRGLTSYLNEQKFLSKEEVRQKYLQFSEQIADILAKKNELTSVLLNTEGNNEHIYSKINNQINELDEKYLKVIASKKNIELTIAQKKYLIVEYNNELLELQATKEANELLPKIEHQLNCPLCKQKVIFEAQNNSWDIFNINEIIHQLKDKVLTAEKSIAYSLLQVNKYEKSLAIILEEKTLYENAKNEYRQSISVPYVPEIEALNKLINEMSAKQATVNEGLKIFNKLDEKNSRIKKIGEDISALKEKQQQNKLAEEEKQKLLTSLEQRYIFFLRLLKQKVNNNTHINSNNYLPIYDGAGLLDHDSGGMLLCMQLAYLFAVLFTKKKLIDFKHPGFMMFDTISKYLGTIKTDSADETDPEKILDPDVYERIYRVLKRIGDTFQIIAVENTPPNNISRKLIRYTFHNGEHGLIDMSKNEK